VKLEDVAVLGVGMTRFGVYPERSENDLAREAGLAALDDAGIGFDQVDESFVGYLFSGPMTGVRAMNEFGLTRSSRRATPAVTPSWARWWAPPA
jgi:acetyl-CoA acyltransferase